MWFLQPVFVRRESAISHLRNASYIYLMAWVAPPHHSLLFKKNFLLFLFFFKKNLKGSVYFSLYSPPLSFICIDVVIIWILLLLSFLTTDKVKVSSCLALPEISISICKDNQRIKTCPVLLYHPHAVTTLLVYVLHISLFLEMTGSKSCRPKDICFLNCFKSGL